jgi:hypothetical protein
MSDGSVHERTEVKL